MYPRRDKAPARHVDGGRDAEGRRGRGRGEDQQARRDQGLPGPQGSEQGHVVHAADLNDGALIASVVWRDDAHLHHLHRDIGARLRLPVNTKRKSFNFVDVEENVA